MEIQYFQNILENKIAYYGDTKAAFEFAIQEFATRSQIEEDEYILKMLEIRSVERSIASVEDRINELKRILKPTEKEGKSEY